MYLIRFGLILKQDKTYTYLKLLQGSCYYVSKHFLYHLSKIKKKYIVKCKTENLVLRLKEYHYILLKKMLPQYFG